MMIVFFISLIIWTIKKLGDSIDNAGELLLLLLLSGIKLANGFLIFN